MKLFNLPVSLMALTLGACLISPTSSYADRKIKVWRDLDGDGHYNKKTYTVPSRGNYYRGNDHHHHHYNYGRRYYDYGYRQPYYGYGYARPYYYGPSFGLSFYNEPAYYSSERYVYRSAPRSSTSYESSLAADVQQALKRRGYYRGSVDGDIGPASRSAIRAYQADRGLSVTGRIDRSLLEALGIG